MEDSRHIENAILVAIVPFRNGNKYRVVCIVENIFKWKKTSASWCLNVRNTIYSDGLFKQIDDIVNQEDKKITLGDFYNMEKDCFFAAGVVYYPCFDDEKDSMMDFEFVSNNSLLRNYHSLTIMNLFPIDIFKQIFIDLTVTDSQKKLLDTLLDINTQKEKYEQIPPLLFHLEKLRDPLCQDPERTFCSRAASCYNLILSIQQLEQTPNTNTMLQNSYTMILKCARVLADVQQ